MSANEPAPNGHSRSPERDTDSRTATESDKGQDNAPKRKASSPPPAAADDLNQSLKRTKLENNVKDRESTGALSRPTERSTDRRENAQQEEKKRGKRLFGGLLSTLSQTTSSSQQKRRQEIERRQQDKVHQQRAQYDKQREEKLAKLNHIRQIEQLGFEERVMKTRHANMLAMARFLETRSTPKIFYLPWDPTEEQEDIIKDQIREAEATVEREVHEFKRQKQQRAEALGIEIESEPPTSEPKEIVGSKTNDEHLTDLPKSIPTANRPPSFSGKAGHEKEPDRADDVMIEEVEDTVIY